MRGCQHCKIFEGVVVKALLCPIQEYAPIELVHVDFTSIETTMDLNQPPSVKKCLSPHRSLHKIHDGIHHQKIRK